MKVIFYYQTFTGLKNILQENSGLTHIHLSSIHFGLDNNKTPYIHLNNESPYSKTFDSVWDELETAFKLGIEIKLMIGGAGGGYASFFSNIEIYYDLLYNLIKNKPIISGIDLDIEEPVSISNVKLLITKIRKDFSSSFTICMAPIQSSLETDSPGMGGFVYKDLINSKVGNMIDYFNVQFYSNYTLESYDNIIKNGYKPEMIVMGILWGETYKTELKKTIEKYKNNFGGVFVWEYSNINNPQDFLNELYNNN